MIKCHQLCRITFRSFVKVSTPQNVTKTINVIKCCDGWTGEKCTKALCQQPCLNGGFCVGPQKCNCAGTNYQGPPCNIGEYMQLNVIYVKWHYWDFFRVSYIQLIQELGQTIALLDRPMSMFSNIIIAGFQHDYIFKNK